MLEFEAKALAAAGVAHSLIPPRYRTGYFQHIFAGGWYAAGYYSYIWSEVLDADTVEWFKENGGLTRANGDFFRGRAALPGQQPRPAGVLPHPSAAGSAELEPLLKRRGLD